MCQDSFDSIFDFIEEIAGSTAQLDYAKVEAVSRSGRNIETCAKDFITDNTALRRHLCASLSLNASTTFMDLDSLESLSIHK